MKHVPATLLLMLACTGIGCSSTPKIRVSDVVVMPDGRPMYAYSVSTNPAQGGGLKYMKGVIMDANHNYLTDDEALGSESPSILDEAISPIGYAVGQALRRPPQVRSSTNIGTVQGGVGSNNGAKTDINTNTTSTANPSVNSSSSAENKNGPVSINANGGAGGAGGNSSATASPVANSGSNSGVSGVNANAGANAGANATGNASSGATAKGP